MLGPRRYGLRRFTLSANGPRQAALKSTQIRNFHGCRSRSLMAYFRAVRKFLPANAARLHIHIISSSDPEPTWY